MAARLSAQLQEGLGIIARDRRRVWLLLTAVTAFALVAFVWLRSRADDALPVIPVAGVTTRPTQAVLTSLGRPSHSGGALSSERREPAAAHPAPTLEPVEPKAIRVDDLPREPAQGARRH